MFLAPSWLEKARTNNGTVGKTGVLVWFFPCNSPVPLFMLFKRIVRITNIKVNTIAVKINL